MSLVCPLVNLVNSVSLDQPATSALVLSASALASSFPKFSTKRRLRLERPILRQLPHRRLLRRRVLLWNRFEHQLAAVEVNVRVCLSARAFLSTPRIPLSKLFLKSNLPLPSRASPASPREFLSLRHDLTTLVLLKLFSSSTPLGKRRLPLLEVNP